MNYPLTLEQAALVRDHAYLATALVTRAIRLDPRKACLRNDLIQDCLLAMCELAAGYDASRPYKPWAYTVCRVRIIQTARRLINPVYAGDNSISVERGDMPDQDEGYTLDPAEQLDQAALSNRAAEYLVSVVGERNYRIFVDASFGERRDTARGPAGTINQTARDHGLSGTAVKYIQKKVAARFDEWAAGIRLEGA